jgi:hypothetical protein
MLIDFIARMLNVLKKWSKTMETCHNPITVDQAYKMLECKHAHVYAERTLDGKHAEITFAECGLVMTIDITLEKTNE